MKSYIILHNNEKIRVQNLELQNNNISFELSLKYFNYFNSEQTSLKEGFFKGFFKKSASFFFNTDIVPEYKVIKDKLIIKTEIEEI